MLKSFAKSFTRTKVAFADSEKKKTFAGSHVVTLAALAIKNPYMDL